MQYECVILEWVIVVCNVVVSVCECVDVNVLGKVESGLCVGLGQFFVLVENYLQFKVNESFQFFFQCISGLENGIVDCCELYNEVVNLNNVCIE